MPNNTITVLGVSCGILSVGYLALIIATMCFAAWETGLAASLQEREVRIAALETKYYDAIGQVNGESVASAGLTTPSHTRYVAAAGGPTVSLIPTPERAR